MFFIKIFHFLKGYVILSVTGHNKEEFLNEFLLLGAKPFSVTCRGDKTILTVSAADFLRIRSVKTRAAVRIEKKCGGVFMLKKLKKRYFLIIGAILLILCFAAGSRFIWTVELEGAEKYNQEQLYSALELAGIKPGTFKPMMKSPLEIKNIVLNNTDGISWAWLYIKGTKAVLKVRESIIPPQVFDTGVPCDIVAMRSGVIKHVITKRGKCVVTENQTVEPGDTIISGTYEFENEPGYQVHASGIAEAYTTHTAEGTYKQYYCYKTYTGRKRRFIDVQLWGKNIPLYFSKNVKFENYDKDERNHELRLGKDNYLGIGAKITVCSEYDLYKEQLSYDAAVEMAKNELEKQISGELLPNARLINKNAEANSLDPETISVRVTMDFIERIGTEKRIEEVTFIEPKTDKPAAGD